MKLGDPIANLDVVRDFQTALCRRAKSFDDAAGRPSAEIGSCWRKVAFLYRRALVEHHLVIQQTAADVNSDGQTETLFRFAIRDVSTCYGHDDSQNNRWTYALRGEGDLASSFNADGERGDVFVYRGALKATTFFWKPGEYITSGFSVRTVDSSDQPIERYGDQSVCLYR